MKKVILLALVALALNGCKETESDPYVARVYNPDVIKGETAYLQSLDPEKLSENELAAVKARIVELAPLLEYDWALYRDIPRPPVPCPAPARCIPQFTNIYSLVLGIYSELPDKSLIRLINENGAVFATGKLQHVDPLLRTAWYDFTVVTPALASEPLLIDITTQITIDKQVTTIKFNTPVDANTFVVKK